MYLKLGKIYGKLNRIVKGYYYRQKNLHKITSASTIENERINLIKHLALDEKSKSNKEIIRYVQTKTIEEPQTIGKRVRLISPSEEVKCMLPNVYGISKQKEISFLLDERAIYEFTDAIVLCRSDFIIKNGSAYWDKFYYPAFSKNLPQDYHLIDVELTTKKIKIVLPVKEETVEFGFSLMGVHSNSWSHFLTEQFEKINHLTSLPVKLSKLTILIQKGIDPHILQLIKERISSLGCRLMEVDVDTSIRCKKYYHVDRGSILTDHANYCSINDVIIRPEVSKYLSGLKPPYPIKQDLKLFIGRKNGRSIINYKEVLELFVSQGFVEVFPHELDFEEKKNLFARASHIAGPGSSGFANAVFCQDNVKILFFINYARKFDMLMAGMLRNYKTEYWSMTGMYRDKLSINSDYYMPIQVIEQFFATTNYLDPA